jgi:hypothetical protein
MRLIDADALMKRIEDSARNAGLHQADYCKIRLWVATSHTIDAVEVVRCNDCMYKEVPKCCPYQISGFAVPDDWYCPMGVKKNAAD